jgi:hypothetical protein
MAKASKTADATVETTVELIFDGINWIDPNAPAFDFDSFEFDGVNWIPKA